LGTPGSSTKGSQTGHSPVQLCLRGGGSRAGLDDLLDPALGGYGHDESLSGGGWRKILPTTLSSCKSIKLGGTGPKICRWKTNIRLIFQPAYSPEVNPVEHLWEEVREKYLHNRIFPSLEDLIEVLCRALTELTDDTQRLRSMMFFPHFRTER